LRPVEPTYSAFERYGIVDHRVNAAENPHRGIDKPLHLRAVCDVGRHGERLAASPRQFIRQSLDAVLPPRAEHDGRSLGGEKPCRGCLRR